jgi:hypothetical protein
LLEVLMTEREMEDLLWEHTERFLGEPLKKLTASYKRVLKDRA